MFLKRRLEFRDQRPFDLHLSIAPMVLVLGVPGPSARKADGTCEADLPVDYQDTAICAINAPGGRGMVVGELTAGLAHHAHIGVVQTPTRADAVEKNADLNASPRPLAKRVPELAAQFIG